MFESTLRFLLLRACSKKARFLLFRVPILRKGTFSDISSVYLKRNGFYYTEHVKKGTFSVISTMFKKGAVSVIKHVQKRRLYLIPRRIAVYLELTSPYSFTGKIYVINF